MLGKAKISAAVLMLALPFIPPAQAEHESGPAGVLFKLLRAVKNESRRIDEHAMSVYQEVPRTGSCEARRAHILALLPDALRFARLAHAVGEDKHAAKMRTEGLATLDLGGGHTAHFEVNGKRYAEVIIDD